MSLNPTHWIALALAAALPVRVLLDLLPGPWASGITVLAGLGFGIAAWMRGPWRVVGGGLGALFVGWVMVGLLRAPTLAAGARYGAHFLIPWLYLQACARWPVGGRGARWALWAGGLSAWISVGYWLGGQPALHVEHGYPRLIGGYDNLHSHAVAMSWVVVTAVWWAGQAEVSRGERLLGAGVGLVAMACLLSTWVRTSLLLVILSVAVLWGLQRRWRLLGGGLALGVLALALSPALQDRFSDVFAVLTLTPPEGGWWAIGSWRGHIWEDSWRVFRGGPVLEQLLGRGLGGHMGLHKDLDPHNEYLALLYQLGPLGVVLWLGMAAQGAWLAYRSETAIGRLAVALLVGVVATNGISNDFLTRSTATWWVWGAVGSALWRGRAHLVPQLEHHGGEQQGGADA